MNEGKNECVNQFKTVFGATKALVVIIALMGLSRFWTSFPGKKCGAVENGLEPGSLVLNLPSNSGVASESSALWPFCISVK